MAFTRPTAKRILGWSAVFLLGFIAGGLVMESVSAYAIGSSP